ncbi:MAG: LPS export ABC transporter permease LptF [Deltaproteobacteria bacterium]|nr:LPS export ABC transporter permease LptF [Deltaproteobacteria bacterium]
MRINTIVYRYIFKEMIPPFGINLIFFSFIFLMTQIIQIMNLVVNHRVGLSVIGWMILYTLPFFMEFIIPMSIMMSVLLTFLRLSGDNEILALKNGGLSVYNILPPVMLFCLIGALLTASTALYGLPWGRMSIKNLTAQVASTNLDIGIKERTFIDSFKGVMLYVNKMDSQTRTLSDVFIEDQRTQDAIITVVAPKGQMESNPDTHQFLLRLYDGTINQVDIKSRSVNTVRFATYDIHLDTRQALAAVALGPKHPEEMSLTEIRQYLTASTEKNSKYYLTLMEFHKKFSLPFACIALGLLAVPLGIQSKSSRRSFGISLGIFFFLMYYMLLSAGWVFGEKGIYPPLLGMWVPNLITAGAGFILLHRANQEMPSPFSTLAAGITRIFRRLRKSAV